MFTRLLRPSWKLIGRRSFSNTLTDSTQLPAWKKFTDVSHSHNDDFLVVDSSTARKELENSLLFENVLNQCAESIAAKKYKDSISIIRSEDDKSGIFQRYLNNKFRNEYNIKERHLATIFVEKSSKFSVVDSETDPNDYLDTSRYRWTWKVYDNLLLFAGDQDTNSDSYDCCLIYFNIDKIHKAENKNDIIKDIHRCLTDDGVLIVVDLLRAYEYYNEKNDSCGSISHDIAGPMCVRKASDIEKWILKDGYFKLQSRICEDELQNVFVNIYKKQTVV